MNKHHPVYEPKKWNSNVNIKQSHNCYAYALNTIHAKQSIKCRKYMNATKKIHCISNKPQVGRYSRIADPKLYTCKNIEYRMLNDNPTIRKLKKNEDLRQKILEAEKKILEAEKKILELKNSNISLVI